MNGELKLTLETATPSVNGGFVLKLVNAVNVNTAFGAKEQKLTYYMKVKELATGVIPGFSAVMNIDNFDVVVRDFIPEEGENAGAVIPCKWLQLKPAA